MKPSDLVKITGWRTLGGKLATRIVKDSDKGISQDGDGVKFPPYSKRNSNVGWRRIKTKKGFRSVFIDSYYNLKAAGKASPKAVAPSRQVSPPNLRLTGEMLNSIYATNPTKQSVDIVFRSGLKVLGNANPPKRLKKPRRNIYGLNNGNQEFVQDFVDDKIDKNIKIFSRKTIKFEINI